MCFNWAGIERTNNNEADVQNKIYNPQGNKMLLYVQCKKWFIVEIVNCVA
jgi:hypothetical protein